MDAFLNLRRLLLIERVLHFSALELDGQHALHVDGAERTARFRAVTPVLKGQFIAGIERAHEREDENDQPFRGESQKALRGDHASMSVPLRNR